MDIMNLNAAIMLEKESSYKKEIRMQELEEDRDKWMREF